MKRNDNEKIKAAFWLPYGLHKKLRRESVEKDMPMSRIVEMALKEFLGITNE